VIVDLFAGLERVLCVGAHPDDIEIGAGGTIRTLRNARPGVDIRWLVLTSTDERAREATESALRHLGDADRLTLHGFRDGHLPYDDPAAVKAAVVDHRAGFSPDLVLAPRPGDAHQDHRLVGELVWQVYRTQTILHYEIPKYEGDLGSPNLYVPLAEEVVERKVGDLFATYASQTTKPWFDESLFRGIMRLRGVEAAAPSGYAEAFEAPKLVVR
jgi:LmbE family N-acetylglucosaminyl deacetylase